MKKITLAIMSLAAALASVSVADAQDAIDAIRQAKESRMESGRDLAPAPQIINVEGRKITSLDGLWRVIVDPFENGYYNYRKVPFADKDSFFADRAFSDDTRKLVEYDFNTSDFLQVPGDWNTQKDELYYYEGTVWYRRVFGYEPKPGTRTFIYFGGANYETVAALNGRRIGRHVGGFTPFNFEVTDLVKAGDNSLVVKVDNKRSADAVPTDNSDWWNYGGITRSVVLVETPMTFIRDYSVRLEKGRKNVISGWVQLDGEQAEQNVTISIPELKSEYTVKTDESGYAVFEFKAKPQLWCPENPKLYSVDIKSETDSVTDRIGFRTIETSGTKILLNGKEVFCKGVSIHEEMPYGNNGRAYNEDHARILLGWAKEMGCNFVRLAHYPHNEAMVRTAEEMGLMVWSEIPVYWTIQWENPATYANAENQLEEMITRDRNRANVVIWSVANETPHGDARLKFLVSLISKARELDDTRLVSAAMEKAGAGKDMLTVDDDLMDYVDLISFNQYVGWYDGTSEKCDRVNWVFDVQKPVFVSEFGAGCLAGLHGDADERFTEEYMADYYRRTVGMLDRIPGLAGTTPWVLKDFRSPRRLLVGIQDDFNRKGLVSDQGYRKPAFYIMKDWYSTK